MLHAEHVRAGRAALKISQVELADICGVSFNTIYKIEEKCGLLRQSKVDTLEKIKNGFAKKGITFFEKDGDAIIRVSPKNPLIND
jgi:DNA-binding XRE family transcriptional regulator